jgi:hypothetical protein
MTGEIKIREAGSLVLHWVNKSLKLHPGVVIEVLPKSEWIFDYTIPVYKVLSSLGCVAQFTEAALRDITEQNGVSNVNQPTE